MSRWAPDPQWSKDLRGATPLSARARAQSVQNLSPRGAAVRGTDARLASLESQLRTLRAEHEALRRCLDKSGVLAAVDVERELKTLAPAATVPAAHLSTPRTWAAAAASAAPSAPGRQASRATLEKAGDRGRQPSASASTAPGSPVASLGRLGTRASPDKDKEEGESNLYAVLQPLIAGRGGLAENRALQRVLQSGGVSLKEWSGPGTPLNACVQAGKTELVKSLLRARASANEPDQRGVTAVHLAVFDGAYEMCRLLLAAAADVHSTDRHGQTPLFFAPSQDICKALVARRADVATLNKKGQTALHLAGRAGLKEVFSYLLSHMSEQVADVRDMHGATALDYAKQAGASWAETIMAAAAKARAAPASAASRAGVAQAKSHLPQPPATRGRVSTGSRAAPQNHSIESSDKKVLKGGGGGRSAPPSAAGSTIPRPNGASTARQPEEPGLAPSAIPPANSHRREKQDDHDDDGGEREGGEREVATKYFDLADSQDLGAHKRRSRAGAGEDLGSRSIDFDIMDMYGGLEKRGSELCRGMDEDVIAALAEARANGASDERGSLEDLGIFDGEDSGTPTFQASQFERGADKFSTEAGDPEDEARPDEEHEEDRQAEEEDDAGENHKRISMDLGDECW